MYKATKHSGRARSPPPHEVADSPSTLRRPYLHNQSSLSPRSSPPHAVHPGEFAVTHSWHPQQVVFVGFAAVLVWLICKGLRLSLGDDAHRMRSDSGFSALDEEMSLCDVSTIESLLPGRTRHNTRGAVSEETVAAIRFSAQRFRTVLGMSGASRGGARSQLSRV
jgi:hypothetical protein